MMNDEYPASFSILDRPHKQVNDDGYDESCDHNKSLSQP